MVVVFTTHSVLGADLLESGVRQLSKMPWFVTPEKFKLMRRELGYTQLRIAKMFGVSDQAVARWEKAKNPLPGAAKILIWLLYEEQINGNRFALRDYIAAIKK